MNVLIIPEDFRWAGILSESGFSTSSSLTGKRSFVLGCVGISARGCLSPKSSGMGGARTASRTLWIPAFAGMTVNKFRGNDGQQIGGGGAIIVHFNLMSTHPSIGVISCYGEKRKLGEVKSCKS